MLQWQIWQKYRRTSQVIGGETLELPNYISYSPLREAETADGKSSPQKSALCHSLEMK